MILAVQYDDGVAQKHKAITLRAGEVVFFIPFYFWAVYFWQSEMCFFNSFFNLNVFFFFNLIFFVVN